MESIKQFYFDFIENNGFPVDNPREIKVYAPSAYQSGLDASQTDWRWRIKVPTVEVSLGCFPHTDEKYLVPEGTILQFI
jgi:hypothetical protein